MVPCWGCMFSVPTVRILIFWRVCRMTLCYEQNGRVYRLGLRDESLPGRWPE